MKILGLMSAVAVTGLIARPAVAQTLSLKFGHVGEPGSLFEASANEFARCANAHLGDKEEEQVFGSSQLGRDRTSVVEGKSVSVRLDAGGARINKKKNNKQKTD